VNCYLSAWKKECKHTTVELLCDDCGCKKSAILVKKIPMSFIVLKANTSFTSSFGVRKKPNN
jgi:hypothetical protein